MRAEPELQPTAQVTSKHSDAAVQVRAALDLVSDEQVKRHLRYALAACERLRCDAVADRAALARVRATRASRISTVAAQRKELAELEQDFKETRLALQAAREVIARLEHDLRLAKRRPQTLAKAARLPDLEPWQRADVDQLRRWQRQTALALPLGLCRLADRQSSRRRV